MEGMEHRSEPATVAENATSIMASPLSAESVDSASARALEQLRWTYTDNRGDFRQVAALEESNVDVGDAVRAVLGLSPDALAALAAVTHLPAEHRQIISGAIALPVEVQAAVRAVLG